MWYFVFVPVAGITGKDVIGFVHRRFWIFPPPRGTRSWSHAQATARLRYLFPRLKTWIMMDRASSRMLSCFYSYKYVYIPVQYSHDVVCWCLGPASLMGPEGLLHLLKVEWRSTFSGSRLLSWHPSCYHNIRWSRSLATSGQLLY